MISSALILKRLRLRNLKAAQTWTRLLIPNVERWVDRKHGDINFHMAQFLSGHGCFQVYLKRSKKVTSDVCVYCEEIDTAEHTLFDCVRWQEARDEAEEEIGCAVNV